jgi:hypothetical protein
VREEAVIMATTTTRGDGLARRTARKKTMEGGEDTATQQLHYTVDQASPRNGLLIPEQLNT